MRKIVAVVAVCVLFAGCTQEPPKDLYTMHKGMAGFGDELNTPCLILKSERFYVDRSEVPNFLEKHGAKIMTCNHLSVVFEVKGDRDEFAKKIAPELYKLGKELSKSR